MRAISIGASLLAIVGLIAGCGASTHHDSSARTGAIVTPSGRHLSKIAIDYDKGLLVLDPPVK